MVNKALITGITGQDGGLGYNMAHPVSIFYDNAVMNLQMMEASSINGVSKFVFAESATSYPTDASIPLSEEEYTHGYPADGNASYSIAKKLHLIQAEGYLKEYGMLSDHLLLTNKYGPRDIFDEKRSRVVASIIRKFVEAKPTGSDEVVRWGSDNATRDLLYVEDVARAFVLAAEAYSKIGPINVSSGIETSIRNLAEVVADIVGYQGRIVWDVTKPDGQLRRCSDSAKAKQYFGFTAETKLRDGIKKQLNVINLLTYYAS